MSLLVFPEVRCEWLGKDKDPSHVRGPNRYDS